MYDMIDFIDVKFTAKALLGIGVGRVGNFETSVDWDIEYNFGQ